MNDLMRKSSAMARTGSWAEQVFWKRWQMADDGNAAESQVKSPRNPSIIETSSVAERNLGFPSYLRVATPRRQIYVFPSVRKLTDQTRANVCHISVAVSIQSAAGKMAVDTACKILRRGESPFEQLKTKCRGISFN